MILLFPLLLLGSINDLPIGDPPIDNFLVNHDLSYNDEQVPNMSSDEKKSNGKRNIPILCLNPSKRDPSRSRLANGWPATHDYDCKLCKIDYQLVNR